MDKLHEFERYLANKIREFFNLDPIQLATSTVKTQTIKAANKVEDFFMEKDKPTVIPTVPLTPVQVNGYFKVTSNTSMTFYTSTSYPALFDITEGWSVQGMTGVAGSIMVLKSENKGGQDYNWTFEFATSTQQVIQTGNQYVIGATLYPPGQQMLVVPGASGSVSGFYMIYDHDPIVFFTMETPVGFYKGWVVEDLPGLGGPATVKQYVDIPGRIVTQIKPKVMSNSYISSALLGTTGDQLTNSDSPIYFRNIKVTQPSVIKTFAAANVKTVEVLEYIPAPDGIRGTGGAPLRDLDSDIRGHKVVEDQFKEISKRGFDSGAILSLYAVGPQDAYVTETKNYEGSQWNPNFPEHTNYVMYHRVVPLQEGKYLGNTVTIELLPTELGDLMANMYLQCSLPPLTGRNFYTDQVGRAIISQIDFMVNETVIETLYDDWYIIKDQLFLDADEQKSILSAVNGGISGVSQNPDKVIIPLELFFCRRRSGKNKERMRRPFFPICSVWNQKIYIRIKFNTSEWISNSPTPIEIIKPSLIIEEIKLTDAERMYYMNNKIRLIVNRVKKESTLKFTQGQANLSLTANFPVQMISWFIRNNDYETQNRNFYDTRYKYGYTTDYIRTAVPLSFPSGNVNYIDTIQTAKITLNNIDVSSTFQGGLYYSFKQPMEHGLSVPAKNIYMYSFGLSPKEYNQGGYINFSKLNSQTTSLQLIFDPKYSSQIQTNYNLNLYYYGYTVLEFQGGFASLPFL
jgi:hypothetical protein